MFSDKDVEGTELVISMNNLDNESKVDRLVKIIEKNGGSLWEKNGHRRVYFHSDCMLQVAREVYAQPYDGYFDIDKKVIVCTVNKADYSKGKNTLEEYRKYFLDSLKSKIKSVND